MSILEIRPSIGGQESAYKVVAESGVPAWASDWTNKGNWWSGGDTYTGFYWSLVNNHFYLQYGKNASGWAGTRFLDYDFLVQNEHINESGYAEADILITNGHFRGTRTDYMISPVPVHHLINLNGATIAEFTGNTGDTFAQDINNATVHVAIAPQSTSNEARTNYNIVYTTGIFPNANFWAGLSLYNPTPPDYLPGTLVKGGWQSLDQSSGFISTIKSGRWDNSPRDHYSTMGQVDHGHQQIKQGGSWKQARKF